MKEKLYLIDFINECFNKGLLVKKISSDEYVAGFIAADVNDKGDCYSSFVVTEKWLQPFTNLS